MCLACQEYCSVYPWWSWFAALSLMKGTILSSRVALVALCCDDFHVWICQLLSLSMPLHGDCATQAGASLAAMTWQTEPTEPGLGLHLAVALVSTLSSGNHHLDLLILQVLSAHQWVSKQTVNAREADVVTQHVRDHTLWSMFLPWSCPVPLGAALISAAGLICKAFKSSLSRREKKAERTSRCGGMQWAVDIAFPWRMAG